jgi:hypothetical protein
MVASASTEWERIAHTTIRNYLMGEEEAVMRNRKVFALMKKNGRFKYNADGDGIDWKVRYRRATMTTNNGEQTVDFSRVNRHISAYLDYEGYIVSDQITKREKLKNRSNRAIVKIFSRMLPLLTEDMQDQFSEELYVDSSAAGNSDRMTGIESMFAATQTIKVDDGTARTANAADPCGYPNDTYAGISTVLGSEDGSWGTQDGINTTWPFGKGGANGEAYDFWSPVVVNYTSSAFTGTTWEANAVEAMRFGIEAVNSRNKLKMGQVDAILLDRGLFRQYKDTLDSKERINISASNELRSLGFTDVIEQDGVTISSEYGMPAGVGYGWTIKALEFHSMQSQIFEPEGPFYVEESRAWRFIVDVLGQFKFASPRHFFKLDAIA